MAWQRQGIGIALAVLFALAMACTSSEGKLPQAVAPNATEAKLPPAEVLKLPRISPIPAEKQRTGDPQEGYRNLVGKNYVGCGAPRSLVDRFFSSGGSSLPSRPASSRGLPFFLNGYTTDDGTPMATANCLSCHASYLRGSLVMGLGVTRVDFTDDVSSLMRMASLVPVPGQAGQDLGRLIERVKAIGPYIQMRVVGSNAAGAIALALFAHRDPETLAWSDKLLLQEPHKEVTPIDVPAWWLLKKKNAMFFTGGGRGDQARIMMTASALCTDSVEDAREIDSYFPSIRSYILSLEAPKWPFALDEERAASGEKIFKKRCQRCHGSYGSEPSYPNLLVSIEEVGTDPSLAVESDRYAAPYRKWFAESFYGEHSRLEPSGGYVAPPLDGIWATGPYFHNGSVPTVEAVLDSSKRPKRWQDLRDRDQYLEPALGFYYSVPAKESTSNKWVYDTSLVGHANTGHTYGDSLSTAERGELLEYLKTL